MVGAAADAMQQFIPLYSLLLSVGNPTVNLFVLDIEGAEFEVSYSFCRK